LVVLQERKGTAILRSLVEQGEFPWDWDRSLSSSTLDQVPLDRFRHAKVLIFDDMVRTGRGFQSVVSEVRNRGAAEVRCVAYAIHRDASSILDDNRFDLAWYERDLSTEAYERTRNLIIRSLQDAGSLMLDTEHLEIRFRLREPLGRLLQAISRRSEVVIFRSGRRMNITVVYPDDAAHHVDPSTFLWGTETTATVKKCRIVQRSADTFAAIPIFLPAIPAACSDSDVSSSLFHGENATSAREVFYRCALLASFKPLEWLVRDIYASGENLVDFVLPLPDADVDETGYDLRHLRVMYPGLDIPAITQKVVDVFEFARKRGRSVRGKRTDRPVFRFAQEDGRVGALHLIQGILALLDERNAERWIGGSGGRHLPGLTAADVMSVGSSLGFTDAQTSALMDMLIDEANVVTRVEPLTDQAGRTYLQRTFMPDGEIVSDLVRRFNRQRGLPQRLYAWS
jgi:hypothetical protein